MVHRRCGRATVETGCWEEVKDQHMKSMGRRHRNLLAVYLSPAGGRQVDRDQRVADPTIECSLIDSSQSAWAADITSIKRRSQE